MTEPERKRKRRRPALSCTLCRARKIRCDREDPCGNCVRSRNGTCVYEKQFSHPVNAGLSTPERESDSDRRTSTDITVNQSPTATSHTTPTTHAPVTTTRKLVEGKTYVITTTSQLAGTFSLLNTGGASDSAPVIIKSIKHKTRLFGQSHWCIGMSFFRDVFEIADVHGKNPESKVATGLQKCKALAKIIKSERTPAWPTPLTNELPTRQVADKLVECYFQTIERVYRVLHIPTFEKDYASFWLNGNAEPDETFLVQLKLILAIGAATLDDEFSMRASAIKWVYEAQTWIAGASIGKSHLELKYVQASILLLFAREAAGIGEDLVWISAGSLLRMAIYMGLHRDPAIMPKTTNLATEMRRRLWNTILELTLQASMLSGGPPLVSLEDFDAKPPGNFNDEQLEIEGSPRESPDSFSMTQMSVPLALRQTFPCRLSIVKFLNDINPNSTYEQTLRLDANLRSCYKQVRQSFGQGWRASDFGTQVMELIVHRSLLALHMPYFGPAMQSSTYTFSRKVVVENSLKIWTAVYPQSSIFKSGNRLGSLTDLSRLALCGSGFFRLTATQAAFAVVMELRTLLQEDPSTDYTVIRPDLVAVVNDTKDWSLRDVEIGGTNVKGYLLICALATQIESIARNLKDDALPGLLIKAIEDAEDKCLPILEKQANAGTKFDGFDRMTFDLTPDFWEDWDYIFATETFNMEL